MPEKYTDFLGAYPEGCNSGVEPLLLSQRQCAFSVNATFRGGYITHRPPFFKQTLNFNGDAALQAAVEQGYFQGAWWYRPDFGLTQIIASISGRIFSFTKIGDSWTVKDISIPGDLNDPTVARVWMWQSEKWLIISDGSGKLPIFYDGVSCRRSYGPSRQLGVTTGAAYSQAKPSDVGIGGVLTVVLTSNWTGPYDVPVIFNGEFYQPTQNSSGAYSAILTNLHATEGQTVPVGTNVEVKPGNIGFITQRDPVNGVGRLHVNVTLTSIVGLHPYNAAPPVPNTSKVIISQTTTLPYPPNYGTINGDVVFDTIFILDAALRRVEFQSTVDVGGGYVNGGNNITFGPNALVKQLVNTSPTVIVGKITTPFAVPAVGVSIPVKMDQAYSGPDGQTVWIGDEQYSISQPPPPGDSTTLYLVNLTDTSTTNYAPPLTIYSVPELPAGRMGAYIQQRNVMSLVDGLSFIVGDIVGGAAGTQASNYRDSVLKTTENDFLAAGGTFRIPSAGNIITSITATAVLDAAFGQGDGQIGTDSGMWGLNLPTNRAEWTVLTNVLLPASLLGFGPQNQLATILSNSDILFRYTEGLASLKFARREFNEDTGGNTPISREMSRIFDKDEKTLLPFGSAIGFNNRRLDTAAPTAGPQGVYHAGIVAMNFDLLSTLRGKAPPIYDGVWSGLNTLQMVTGNFSGTGRAYAFGYNENDSKIELYELRAGGDGFEDNGVTPIQWNFESPPIFRPESRGKGELLARLSNGQIHVRDVRGIVKFKILYRPDFWPCWIDWHSFDICADTTVKDGQPGYRTPIGFGEPSSEGCEAANNRPYRVGRFFQIRVEVTGSCKIMGMDFEAVHEPGMFFVPPLCEKLCSESDTLPVPGFLNQETTL